MNQFNATQGIHSDTAKLDAVAFFLNAELNKGQAHSTKSIVRMLPAFNLGDMFALLSQLERDGRARKVSTHRADGRAYPIAHITWQAI